MTKEFLSGKKGPYLMNYEKSRFTNAFYYVWDFLCIFNSSTARGNSRRLLAKKDLREMSHLSGIGLWTRKLLYFLINDKLAMASAAKKFTSGTDGYQRLSAWDWPKSRAWVRRSYRAAGRCRVQKPLKAPVGMLATFSMWQNHVELIQRSEQGT